MTNINPETGIRYGCIYLNELDSDVANDLWINGEDLSYKAAYEELKMQIERDADNVEDEVSIGIAETDPSLVGNEAWFERRCEDAWNTLGYDSREDYVETRLERESEHIYIDEPNIAGTYEGVKYEISHLGGAPLLWTIHSPIISKARLCSPCCPGAIDLNSLDDDGYEGYGIPDDWRYKE
jgi:hypothetical protein